MSTIATPGADAYTLPQEFKDFQQTIRELVAGEIAPRAAEIDRTGEYPWDVRKTLAEHDILGPALPGGAGRHRHRHADAERGRRGDRQGVRVLAR